MKSQIIRFLSCALIASSPLWATGCGSDGGGSSPTTPTLNDDSPPLVPTGLHVAKSDRAGCSLAWKPSTEADLAGYYVYVYDPAGPGNAAYVPLHLMPHPRNGYVFVPSQSPTPQATYVLRVSAVDVSGNESALSSSIEFTAGAAPPEGEVEQDPNVNGDQFTDSGGGSADEREPPGVPGRNPSIEQPERR